MWVRLGPVQLPDQPPDRPWRKLSVAPLVHYWDDARTAGAGHSDDASVVPIHVSAGRGGGLAPTGHGGLTRGSAGRLDRLSAGARV